MKKGYFIIFLLLTFLLPVCLIAGVASRDKIPAASIAVCTSLTSCTNPDQCDLPALFASHDCCVASASVPGKGSEKIISYTDIHFTRSDFFLQGKSTNILANEPSHQKKYLFYIYPSHDFW